MKAFMWMVGWVLVSSSALAQEGFGKAEVPAVRRVAVVTEEGCGTQPSFRPDLPCPSVQRVSFEVETTGLCDVFMTELDVSGDDTYLTIVKQRIEHCTRPEHQPRVEARSLFLADELRGAVRLGNPLIVERHFRQ